MGPFLAVEIRHLVDLVREAPVATHDADVGLVLQQQGVGCDQAQFEDALVYQHRLAELPCKESLLGTGLLRPLYGKHRVSGRERRAVVEFHARAQGEAPSGVIHHQPALGQRGHRLLLRVNAHEPLVDMTIDVGRQALVEGVRVHRRGVAMARPAKSLGVSVGHCADEQGQAHRAEEEQTIHALVLRSAGSRGAQRGRASIVGGSICWQRGSWRWRGDFRQIIGNSSAIFRSVPAWRASVGVHARGALCVQGDLHGHRRNQTE